MLTIVVPTKNRSDFLRRLIRYFADCGFKHTLFIGDSSQGEHLEKNKVTVAEFLSRLRIVHHLAPDTQISGCVRDMSEKINTKYTALIADDDFLVPSGIDASIAFLDKNADYSACHGKAVVFSLDESGPYGQIAALSPYPQPMATDDSASERLVCHLKNYSVTLFSVHRSGAWKTMWKSTPAISDIGFSAEILPCCLSVVLGKVAEVDSLFLIRQTHDNQYLLPDHPYDWIIKPDWYPSYKIFFETLSAELAKKDGISIKEAKETVKKAFYSHLDNQLSVAGGSCSKGSWPMSKLIKIVKSIPFAKNVAVKAANKLGSNIVSLSSLKDKSSKYFTDFVLVCNAVRKKAVL